MRQVQQAACKSIIAYNYASYCLLWTCIYVAEGRKRSTHLLGLAVRVIVSSNTWYPVRRTLYRAVYVEGRVRRLP